MDGQCKWSVQGAFKKNLVVQLNIERCTGGIYCEFWSSLSPPFFLAQRYDRGGEKDWILNHFDAPSPTTRTLGIIYNPEDVQTTSPMQDIKKQHKKQLVKN